MKIQQADTVLYVMRDNVPNVEMIVCGGEKQVEVEEKLVERSKVRVSGKCGFRWLYLIGAGRALTYQRDMTSRLFFFFDNSLVF